MLEDATVSSCLLEDTEISKKIKLDKKEGEDIIDRVIQEAGEVETGEDRIASLIAQLNESENLYVRFMLEKVSSS